MIGESWKVAGKKIRKKCETDQSLNVKNRKLNHIKEKLLIYMVTGEIIEKWTKRPNQGIRVPEQILPTYIYIYVLTQSQYILVHTQYHVYIWKPSEENSNISYI